MMDRNPLLNQNQEEERCDVDMVLFSSISPHSGEKDEKEWRRELYARRCDGDRHNAKEERQRNYLKRVALRAKKDAQQAAEEKEKIQKVLDSALDELDENPVHVIPHSLESACNFVARTWNISPHSEEEIVFYKPTAKMKDSSLEPHGLTDDYTDPKTSKEYNEAWLKDRHPRDYRTGPYTGPLHDPNSEDEQRRQMQEELEASEQTETVTGIPEVPMSQADDDFDFGFIDERNRMARIIEETAPFDKNDDGFAGVLKSVGSAKDYIPEGVDPQDLDQIDQWISHLENLTILSYQMYRAQSFLDMFVAIVSYAKMYVKKSLIIELYKLIDEVTTTARVDPHAMQDWTGRRVLDNWELFKTNTIWKKVSYLISAAMSLTACTTKEIEWSPFGLKLVAVEAAKEQLKAVDVLDALIKTFVWFVEVGAQCIEQKSLAPLLYSDAKIAAYDKNCDYVLAYADTAIAGNIDDLGEYEKRLEECISRTAILKSAKSSGPSALWLQNRYVELVGIKEKLVAKRRNTDIRQKPDGWSITGGTKVGKTVLADLTMKQSLMAQGYCPNGKVPNDRILTKDMFDKYDSTWTSDILGVFMDDLGNSKPQTNSTDMNHTAVIIKFFNNVAAQAIKAELNSKGVVFIDFRCGVVTSNVMDLDARSYSNCPESILRRFNHVTVKVKEKYRAAGSTTIDQDHPELLNAKGAVVDVWELCIWDCFVYETADGKSAWKWKLKTVRMDDGTDLLCKDLGLEQYLDCVRVLALRHKRAQEAYVERTKRTNEERMCKNCLRFPIYCRCDPSKVEPHSFELGDIVINAAKQAAWKYIESWIKPVQILNNVCGFAPIKNMTTAQLAKILEHELDRQVTPILAVLTPEWLYKTSVFQASLKAWQHTAALYDMRRTLFRFAKLLTYGVILTFASSRCPRILEALGIPIPRIDTTRNRVLCTLSLMGAGMAAAWGQYMHALRMAKFEEEFRNRRDALPEFAKRVRDGAFPKGVLLTGTLILGIKVLTMWNANRISNVTVVPQGITPDDVEKQPGWFGHMLRSIGFKVLADPDIRNSTTGQVMTTLQKNVFWAVFKRSDGTKTQCNIFFPRKSVALFPMHVFYEQCNITLSPCAHIEIDVRRSDKPGGFFSFKCEFSTSAASDGLDMCAVFVPNCPDIKSAVKWLPLTNPTGRSMCNMVFRDKGIKINWERVCVEHGLYGHKHMSFFGGMYTSKEATGGLCMAPLIAEGKPVIAGFHIGGDVERSIGVMQTLTKPLYDQMIDKLKQIPGVELSAEAVDIPEKQYGKIVVASPDVHPHAKFVRELDEKAYIEVIGSTRLRASAKSKVEQSILSPYVEKHFRIKNCWGAPRLVPNWRAFNATLEHIINPSSMFLPTKLERARKDWIRPILEFARKHSSEGGLLRRLTMKEAIMGIPGVRFLDAIPMTTGMGFPIFGPKSKWFTDVYDDNGVLIDRIPHPDVVAELNRLLTAWARGERAYPVTTATLKDQPTAMDEDKVRVFQAGAIAMSIAIRMFFLPIARLLSLIPLISESAVGVNAFSQQWHEMMSHVTHFATDGKVIAWDYSKYDVRMNSQVTRAVWLSFVEIAECGKYLPHDLMIMRNMIVDIVHPLIDYNGTMIMAYNMNTSGNNLTVNVNGTAGSLYVRMGFFEKYPDVTDFRKCVAALTYGDDFKGSVKEGYRDFNFLSFKEFLAQHGMKITLPDKSDDEVAFMWDHEADFLKRNSVWIPEIGTSIGALDEKSIFKSLHCNLRSKGATKLEVAMSCIDGAMHEWFAHGREVYEDRRQKMMAVCDELKLPMPSVQATFDERVEAWKEKYL